MYIFLEIFRTSYPTIAQIEYKISFSIDVASVDNYRALYIDIIDMNSSFLKEFSLGSLKKAFTFFFFSSRKAPIEWPMFWSLRSSQKIVMRTMFENHSGWCGKMLIHLESDIFDKSNNREKDFLSHEINRNNSNKEESSNQSKAPTSYDISRVMHSCNYSCSSC